MSNIKEYSEGDFTVTFDPQKCMHSEHCWRELNGVFKPKERPWIQPDGADRQRVIDQINRCPSGALGYQIDGENGQNITSEKGRIKVNANGPLMVKGPVEIEQADGSVILEERMCALCRCGASSNKPYCDGSHRKVGFEG